jgi:FHA domain
MRTRLIIGTSIASVAVCIAGVVLAAPLMPPVSLTVADVAAFAAQAWTRSCRWAVENYDRTPALMVGLVSVLLLPPLALASGLIARLVLPLHTSAQARLPGEGLQAANVESEHPSYMAWPREAWLTASAPVDSSRPPMLRTMPREMLSIGRGEDNDLVLDEATVHRYHAIIQRTTDALFLIKDLGGPGGNGVFVNDERVTEAHLLDADRISLGTANLVFHARRVGASVRVNLD